MLIPGLKIDPEGNVPVYRQIADGVRAALVAGNLEPGHRLPATRDLARGLGINRQTVVAAYDHLAAAGLVESRTGSGTFLVDARSAAETSPVSDLPEAAPWSQGFSRAVDAPMVGGLLSFYRLANAEGGISFAGSYPAKERMPTAAFRDALSRGLERAAEDLMTYGPTAGHGPLRRHIAEAMTAAGSDVSARDVLITNGAQQAIELVFHTFLEQGDPVVMEEPTYTGALSVLGSLGVRVVGVPLDASGIRLAELARALERHRPRVIYLQPSFQNPTTVTMDRRRREAVLALCRQFGCTVIEDDWADGLRFDPGQGEPTLHALDGGRNVVYLNTFSKKLLPGLRIGWVVAPPPVMERLVRLKQIRDCGTSPLLQAGLHEFLEEGGLDAHLRNVIPVYRERRDAMIAALREHFPADARWSVPEGGLFLWVRLPEEIDTRELLLRAQQVGVVFSSGEIFQVRQEPQSTLRLTYAATTPEQIETGIRALGELIRSQLAARRGDPLRTDVDATPIL